MTLKNTGLFLMYASFAIFILDELRVTNFFASELAEGLTVLALFSGCTLIGYDSWREQPA